MAEYNGFKNIFEALEEDKALADNLQVRAELMQAVENHIKENHLTQAEAAKIMGVSQPRISDLVNGKIDKFTIDMLVNMLSSAGKHVSFRISKGRKRSGRCRKPLAHC